MKNVWAKLRGHFQEYVARYSVLAIAVLTPAAGLLGTLAAEVGTDSQIGRALIGGASALGAAAAGVVFIRNLGIWQMLDTFGTAPGAPQALLSGTLVAGIAGQPDPSLAPLPEPPAVQTLMPDKTWENATDPASVPPDGDQTALSMTDGDPAEPDTEGDEVGGEKVGDL